MEVYLDMTWIVMVQSAKVSISVAKLSEQGLGAGGGDVGLAWEGLKTFVYLVCSSRTLQLILNNKQSPRSVKENVTVINIA